MKNDKNNELNSLIRDAIKGNMKAQEELFKNFYSTMMNICSRYSDQQNEAKDLLQEGYIKIFQNLHQFNFEGSFEGWMKRIMVNTAIDYIRKNKKHQSISIDDVSDSSINQYNFNDAISNLTSAELMSMLNDLPPMSRTVFNMFVFDGFSHAEIAKALNIKEGTSTWHVNNARTILKTRIVNLYRLEEAANG